MVSVKVQYNCGWVDGLPVDMLRVVNVTFRMLTLCGVQEPLHMDVSCSLNPPIMAVRKIILQPTEAFRSVVPNLFCCQVQYLTLLESCNTRDLLLLSHKESFQA